MIPIVNYILPVFLWMIINKVMFNLLGTIMYPIIIIIIKINMLQKSYNGLKQKGRNQFTTIPEVAPFIEWLYTEGMTEERVEDLLFEKNHVYNLTECVQDGTKYLKKSTSLIQSIAETAGFYTFGALKIAIVDAQRQIILLGW